MATRRERVVLSLDDDFSPGMAKAAAVTALLNRELNNLSGSAVKADRSTQVFVRDLGALNREARGADGSINQLTGRLRVFGEIAAGLGPSLNPVGGVLLAGIGGLANQMGIAAVAGGVLIGSLQGVGDALGAMNDAANDPSDANLEKAAEALERMSPAARNFAEAAFDLKPAIVAIRDAGAESLIPGLTDSLDDLERLGPRVASIFQAFGTTLGDIAADSSASLASDRWADFFRFIETEGPSTLSELATTVGDLTHGLSELWQAFTPLNGDFSSWLMSVADGFDEWATGLSATEGFAEFVDYIRTTGPRVADTFSALFNAVVQFVQATAPLGGPVLAGIEAVSNAIATIADSDLGTPILAGVTALSLLNRTLAVTASLSKVSLSSGLFAGLGTVASGASKGAGGVKGLTADLGKMSKEYGNVSRAQSVLISGLSQTTGAAQRTKDSLGGAVKAGAGLAGLGIVATGAADGLGLTNTASLALMGSLAGPPGAAIGAAAGALLDVKASGEGATEAIRGLDAAVQSGSMDVLRDQIAAAKAELADITNLDANPGDIFDRIGFQLADTFGGPSMDDARKKIEASEQALSDLEWAQKKAGIEAKGAALEFLSATDANVNLGKWSRKSAEEIKAQADAILDAREEANKTATSFVNLGESLNDSEVSLEQWIKDMASTADALNNFTTNSIKAAKRGLDDGLIRSLQAAGPEGARRMRQLANGTKEAIDDANAAFRKGEKAIERYNNYKVPPKKIDADNSRALQSFREVDTWMSQNNGRTATMYVNTVRTVTGPQGAAVFGQRADGGSVPKDNGPYRDKFLFMLAPGEEVISNRYGQADQFRADRAAGLIPGYADGGTTGRKDGKRKSSGGFFAVDNTDSLQAAIDRLTMVSEDQTRALDDATRRTDEWSQRMADVAQATISGFNTGLFERDSDPWAAGAGGGWLTNLTRDIAGLQERSGLQSQLASLGLSGDALAALLGQGSNSDISSLINSGQVSQYAALYDQRAALQGSVGQQAGMAAFGQQQAAALAEQKAATAVLRETQIATIKLEGRMTAMQSVLERIDRDLPERIGAAAGREVRGAAQDGQRDNKARGGRV